MLNKAIYVQPAPWAHDDTNGRIFSRKRIAIGIGISLIVHVILYLVMPKRIESEGAPPAASQGPLQVTIAKPPAVAPPPSAAPAPAPRTSPPLPRRTIMAIPTTKPSPQSFPIQEPQPNPPPVPTPPVTRTTEQPSMMALAEAARERRRLAEESAARENATGRAATGELTGEDARNAAIARNMQTLKPPKDGTNGVFQILHKGHRAGEFAFRGWTTDERASVRQVYEVDAGQGGNVELAIVRKMIEIIRTHYKDKFNWESHRLGRVVQLSAKMEETASLEAFMIREFFGS